MKFRVLHGRRKTMCLSVTKKGEVIVRVPFGTGEKVIEDFLVRHRRWIDVRLEKYRARPLDLSDGKEVALFGRTYSVGTGKTGIREGILFLPAFCREEELSGLVKKLALKEIAPRVEETARRYGFSYSGVRISSARTRWGSCSRRGSLSFTRYLAFVDPALVTYVIVHELCHTKYFDHSKNFWLEVERILPDWRVLRARLRESECILNYLNCDRR